MPIERGIDEGPSAEPDDAGFRVRIDELVASALEDQGRQQREQLEILAAARAALAQAGAETAALRSLVERRDRAVVDLLEARLAGVGREETFRELSESIGDLAGQALRTEDLAPVSEGIRSVERALRDMEEGVRSISRDVSGFAAGVARPEGVAEVAGQIEAVGSKLEYLEGRLKATTGEIAQAVAGLREDLSETSAAVGTKVEELLGRQEGVLKRSAAEVQERFEQAASLKDALEEGLEAQRTRLQSIQSSLTRQVGELRKSVEELPEISGEAVARGLEPMEGRMSSLEHRFSEAVASLSRSEERMDRLRDSLIAYMSERDEHMEQTRSEVLGDLIRELTEGLKGRERKHLGEALQVADQRRKDRRDADRWRKTGAVPKGLSDETETSAGGLAAIPLPLEPGGSGEEAAQAASGRAKPARRPASGRRKPAR